VEVIQKITIGLACSFLVSLTSLIHADFILGMQHYEQGKYELAYEEFAKVAKVGNAEAIYNIGVMYSQGQFLEKNIILAYVWMKLANSFDSSYTTITVKNKLSVSELNQANSQYSEFSKEYSQASYNDNLKPFICRAENMQNSVPNDYIAIKKIAPNAPGTARRKQVNGYINVGYSINASGDVVDVDLLDEFPRGIGYAVETLRAVKKFKYPEFKVNENEPALRYATYNIGFHTKKWNKAQARHSKTSVASFIEMANANNSRAQYLLATAVPYLYKAKIGARKRNELLELSAINGYHKAQLLIGLELIQDTKCSTSKSKGENWIKQAAKNGNEIAQKYIDNFINYSALN